MMQYFQKPPNYVLACMLCAANGILFGMDTGIIGKMKLMPLENPFKLEVKEKALELINVVN